MKIRKWTLALAAAGLALGTTQVSADADQPWHLTGQIGGVELDNARDTDSSNAWWSVGFGRFFGNNLSVDLEYDEYKGTWNGAQDVAPGATWDDWKLSHLGLMGRYHIGDGKIRPYVAAGVGKLSHRNVASEDDSLTYRLGLGVQGKIHKHWSARAQFLWQRDNDSSSLPNKNGFNDYIISIGLNLDFGGKPPPPPPAPKEEPAPPPPPPPNPDLDGDGVLNERDKCPNTRPGAVVDLDGCEVEAVIELEGVHFDFDKATLRPEAMVILNEAAALLSKHQKVVVEVAGHTDSIGSEKYNQGLSERRANSVRDYLVSKGVNASRLSAKGYGELRPVASNDTEEGRQENRRVELVVLER